MDGWRGRENREQRRNFAGEAVFHRGRPEARRAVGTRAEWPAGLYSVAFPEEAQTPEPLLFFSRASRPQSEPICNFLPATRI
jgi:hypothetical protein